jgi:CBS domain containing-hemolysin-like protein
MDVVLGLFASFALILVNAFFVASEFAMVKVRPTQLEMLSKKGRRGAGAALQVAHQLDAYLSANQLGITIASLALGWVGEPLFVGMIEPILQPRLPMSAASAHAWSSGIAFALITFFHVVVGELAPKSIAVQRTETVALLTAWPLRAFYRLAFPAIWLFNVASNLVVRALGFRPVRESEGQHSQEELRLILRGTPMPRGPQKLIDRVFDYTNRVAGDVMTLRRDTVTLQGDVDFRDSLHLALDGEYTRYPVLDGGQVLGYVHFKDLVRASRRNPPTTLRPLIRKAIPARVTTPVEELRRDFMRSHVHMGVVCSEDGSLLGIVTLEDLLEEFVGEIQDEQDVEVAPIVSVGPRTYELDARVTLDVFEREMGARLHDDGSDARTVGEYLLDRAGPRPRVGRVVTFPGGRLWPSELREGRVRRVRVELSPPEEVASSELAGVNRH